MKTTIDRSGRVVVPKAARRAARLEPGTELEVRVIDGRIELEPKAARVRLVKRGGLVVAEPIVAKKPVTQAEVNLTLEGLRAGRAR
jgi:AbrB family looped-hinge helix DNA binding protein